MASAGPPCYRKSNLIVLSATVLASLVAVLVAVATVVPRMLRRRWTGAGATLAAVLLLGLAAAGVSVPGGAAARDALVVDVSWSTGTGDPDLAGLGERFGLSPERTGTILFGERPVRLDPADGGWPVVGPADRARAGPGGSDAAAALRAAARLVGRGGRVVLATDGRVDAAGAGAAAAEVRAGGAGLVVAGIGRGLGGDARVDSLRVASRVRAGESFSVLVSVAGPAGATLDLTLLVDGAATARRDVALPGTGGATVRFAAGPLAAGRHEVEARIAPLPGDPAPENDRIASGVVARAGRTALLVGADAAAEALAAADFDVVTAPPGRLPDLAPFDVVVLADVPAPALPDGGAALAAHVRAGGGLVVLGGPHAFGPGGYAGRPLEEALPLLADPPGEGLFVAVLLDRSATMGETGALDGALDATRRLLRALPAKAEFLLVPFTDRVVGDPSPVPLSAPDGPGRAQAAVAAVGEAHGRTSLEAPLRRALEAVRGRVGRKLVLLISDGRADRDDPDRLAELSDAIRAAGARLVVLAAGGRADLPLLDRLAAPEEGAVRIGSPEEIGGVFLAKLLATEGEGRVREGTFPVRPLAGEEAPVPAEVASIRGYVRTWAAPGARTWALAGEGDPVAAVRRYGLGTAIAVATDPLGEWARAWGRTGLVASLAEYAARPAARTGPRVDVARSGDRLRIRVDGAGGAASVPAVLTLPGGGERSLDLPAVGPGRYEATIPVGRPGPGWLSVRTAGGVADGGFAVPWPPEYGETGPDPAGLAALVAAVGEGGPAAEPVRDASPLLALLALFFFLGDRARRILKMRGGIGR